MWCVYAVCVCVWAGGGVIKCVCVCTCGGGGQKVYAKDNPFRDNVVHCHPAQKGIVGVTAGNQYYCTVVSL